MSELRNFIVIGPSEETLAKLKKMDEEEEERKKRNQKYKDIARRHREMKRARKLRGRQLKSGFGSMSIK